MTTTMHDWTIDRAKETLGELRAAYIVRVSHRRIGTDGDGGYAQDTKLKLREAGFEIQPRGGVTIVHIQNQDGLTLARGEAICSTRDNFWKWLGTTIALGRALKQFGRGI